MNKRTKVVVVDDQNISRGFFEMYVRSAVNYELVAGLRTAQEAVEFVEQNEVHLLILDVMMVRGIDGLSAAEQIKKRFPHIKIILTTSASETTWEEKARQIGVESFWYKEYSEHSLLELMDKTMNGEQIYPGTPPDLNFGKISRTELTQRELDILRELTNSLSNEEIAEKLYISTNTVKRHIQNILEKTGFESRLDLAMNAKSLGLVVSDRNRMRNGK